MYVHQRIGIFCHCTSFVLVCYTLKSTDWAYDAASLTGIGLYDLGGVGVSIKLVDAGISKLGYDVVDPDKWPASSSAFCAIASVAAHDPWCHSAAQCARTFHAFALLAAMGGLYVSTHVVLKRRYPSWDGAGRSASLPWATFLSFVQSASLLIVVVAWSVAQSAMDTVCIADKLAKSACVTLSTGFTIALVNVVLSLFVFGLWRVSHKWLEAKASGALMDSFILAAKTDDLDEALAIIAGRADIDGLGTDGRNGLHWAAALNRSAVVHVLLKKGAHISHSDKDGWTPLHWASRMGNPDVVRLLVKHGADVNAKDPWGTTPLMLSLGAHVNARNVFGQTVLMMCAQEDAEMHAFVVLLVNANASLKLRDSQGMNVLHYAAGAGLKNIAATLLECCTPAEIGQLNKFGDSPLHEARLRQRKTTAAILEGNPNAMLEASSGDDSSDEYELRSDMSDSSDSGEEDNERAR
ncbi:hypothetical protein SPRG_08444 [Saprolegnia parasitica CBS 223.65]|uniref:Uncharacterized protein n=1 Tax=Saprolegnia parasitica (strain CBS 223.65) TaxID=695850 RepID=A0A067C6D7_SAPPC|nr:hypothetical protein SPRG_08444 [Saprolegnia parasitica CBS 223.65]KDO26083.1 hypothetical protein SPRG_08444 [Saprolegnia parasitica CBS 223.65]|eukprot:XP_012203079.1 hypothetical protein SPRG_08444 [Saprolegnia parasitica CBS 223.65]